MTTLSLRWNAANETASKRAWGKTAMVWTLQVASAAMFLFAGSQKLTGNPAMVQVFEAIGIGQWFRYVTGAIEVVSAVLLLVPSLAFYGAVALALTMAGAVFTHLALLGGSPAAALVLFVATTAIAWIRRGGR